MNPATLLALLSVKGIGPKKANTLINSLSIDKGTDLRSAIESALSARLGQYEWRSLCIRGEEIIEKSLDSGLSVIDSLSLDYPQCLRRLESPPLVIFVRGDSSAIRTQTPVAIVGSRSPCAHTRDQGPIVSRVVARQATSVISGLAIGCDTIAHREALANNILTVGVVAHGLDTIYPKENKRLADEIIGSGGCLISEYPIGTPPRPNQFIERDRIQAGLSQCGLLLQSSTGGGSMHAMRALRKLNARIGVLSPPPDSERSTEWGGTIELMRMNGTIVLDAASESLSSDAEFLVGKRVTEDSRECFEQASLF